jgi:hypothetical protein
MLHVYSSRFKAVTAKTVEDRHTYGQLLVRYLWLRRGVIAGRSLSRQADLSGWRSLVVRPLNAGSMRRLADHRIPVGLLLYARSQVEERSGWRDHVIARACREGRLLNVQPSSPGDAADRPP